MIKITDRLIGKFEVSDELYYVSSSTGDSRRYHLFHFGFDKYTNPKSKDIAWTMNLVLPFISMYVGYIFRK